MSEMQTSQRRSWDWTLLGIAVLLAGLGLLMILSASSLRCNS